MEIGDGFCAAQADAQAKCASVYKFDDMTVDAKQGLATACGFSWPCKVHCFASQDVRCCHLQRLMERYEFGSRPGCLRARLQQRLSRGLDRNNNESMHGTVGKSLQERSGSSGSYVMVAGTCGIPRYLPCACLACSFFPFRRAARAEEHDVSFPARRSVAGDCEYSVDTAGMTAAQKKAMAGKCVLTFPCAGSAP